MICLSSGVEAAEAIVDGKFRRRDPVPLKGGGSFNPRNLLFPPSVEKNLANRGGLERARGKSFRESGGHLFQGILLEKEQYGCKFPISFGILIQKFSRFVPGTLEFPNYCGIAYRPLFLFEEGNVVRDLQDPSSLFPAAGMIRQKFPFQGDSY